MKTALLTLLILSISVCAFATDFTKVSEETMQIFLKLMPEYKTLVQKHGEEYSPEDPTSQATDMAFLKEVQSLFAKYGMTQELFPGFMQKITMGFAQVQMEASGMGGMGGNPFAAMMPGMPELGEDEKNIIKKYSDKIEAIFEEE